MAKPLQLLQEYTINKKEVVENEDEIIFGEFSFPKNFKTEYEITQKATKEKQYYTIGCLLFFMQNMHIIHLEYLDRAKAANIPAVRRPDRKNIIYFLTGLMKTNKPPINKGTNKNNLKDPVSQGKKDEAKKSKNKVQSKYMPY